MLLLETNLRNFVFVIDWESRGEVQHRSPKSFISKKNKGTAGFEPAKVSSTCLISSYLVISKHIIYTIGVILCYLPETIDWGVRLMFFLASAGHYLISLAPPEWHSIRVSTFSSQNNKLCKIQEIVPYLRKQRDEFQILVIVHQRSFWLSPDTTKSQPKPTLLFSGKCKDVENLFWRMLRCFLPSSPPYGNSLCSFNHRRQSVICNWLSSQASMGWAAAHRAAKQSRPPSDQTPRGSLRQWTNGSRSWCL